MLESIRSYAKRTDKYYLALCLFSSAMAVLLLASWAAEQGGGFATDELTGQITGIGDFRRALVQAAAAGMGLLVALSSLTLFESYNYMEAGIASTLLFVYPILVAVIMALFFKEKLSVQTAACILLAVLGIALLYKGESGATLSATGVVLVFASALSYAVYIVGVNQASLKDVPTLAVTFYVLLFGLSLFVVRLCLAGGVSTPGSWYLWGNLVALAVFPTAISFLCTTSAIQCIGSTPTAILGALEPLTAIAIGIMVFGESLTVREGIGLALIIAAVTFVIAGGSVTQHLVRFRKLFPRLGRRR